jgi:glycosyltransferase A (GT-A) superfamily protein (DUF2064 family)
MASNRIAEVAGEKVLLIGERTPGHRAELVKALVATINAQQEGLSEKGRRDKITKLVEALGSKVSAQGGEA